jgi:hypothetical protein
MGITLPNKPDPTTTTLTPSNKLIWKAYVSRGMDANIYIARKLDVIIRIPSP